jgi:CheY-like chemotaxis protein
MKILIVDDDPNLLVLLKTMIWNLVNREACEIVTTVDGQIGLQLLREEGPFDLIVTDEMMPSISGSELIKVIRSGGTEGSPTGTPRQVPIILNTASVTYDEQRFHKDSVLIMNKPNSIENMRRVIREAMNSIQH